MRRNNDRRECAAVLLPHFSALHAGYGSKVGTIANLISPGQGKTFYFRFACPRVTSARPALKIPALCV
jgi:hypothetical protein